MLGFSGLFLACSKTYDRIASMEAQQGPIKATKSRKTASVALAPFSPAGRQQKKRTYIRNGRERHWIPNSKARWTPTLKAETVLDLIEAVAHARTIGLPVNWTICIQFKRGNLKPHFRAQDAIGYFLKSATQWLATKGVPPTFVWFIEHSMGTGEHVHILMHCPNHCRKRFKELAKTKWIQRAGMDLTDKQTLFQEPFGPRSYDVLKSSRRDQQTYLNQLKGYFRYHLKSIDPDQALPKVTGDDRPVAEWLGIEPHDNLPIYGRRASRSQNISKGARERYAAGKQQSEATPAIQ